MHLHLCHFVSFISATCFALATPASRTTEYEDIPDSLLAVPITNSKGLNYENWSFASTGAIQVGGLESESPNSRVGAAGPTGQPALTPQPPQYKAFSPRFFSFGCVLRTGQAAATVATGCTVTVDGFDAKGKRSLPPRSPSIRH
ncbi:MAG: hypothetical protein LQ339_006602 [Xanthoria mediterranea]|nr:MAG: hypothetical protein LQ339_006602 [Xanthoria mediterranea]